jgi:hypothetical protein
MRDRRSPYIAKEENASTYGKSKPSYFFSHTEEKTLAYRESDLKIRPFFG